ncbi:MAG: ComEC/Rec2 family competence protein [Clostridia bacterium]|nr:ComEC/Rec2 family competence protein [Clostridia bacterium]
MKKKNVVSLIIVVLIGIGIVFSGKMIVDKSSEVVNANDLENEIGTTLDENGDILEIHYIDVGQGDATLIVQGEHAMLIDAGTNDSYLTLEKYLKEQGISKFDYIIGTHPHEDHIGGMDKIIKSFDEDKILFPKITSTTKTFENFVNAVKSKNKKLTTPVVHDKYALGNASFEILAPNSEKYEGLNNYSIVIRITFENTNYIFTGDAEKESEDEIIKNNSDISADVLKVGHHGSKTSSSAKFLTAVNPKYAIISLGKNNSYGHPHKQVMDRLSVANIPVYRTDEKGTIVLKSDGDVIQFNVKKENKDRLKE